MAQSSGVRAGPLPQGFAKGCDGLLEPRRPALSLAERFECTVEIVLGLGMAESGFGWNAIGHARAPILQD
jgi:hypothetical protein